MRIKKLLLVIFITITSNGVGQFNTCFFYPSSVDLFGLCEISFKLPKVYSNPYDPDTICVYAEFTGPDNSVYRVDGFYYEDYTFHQHNEGYEVSTHNSSSDGWRIRFTPSQVGTWTFIIQASDADGCLNMSFMNESHTFSCTIVRKADGFISKANSRFLKREVVENGQKRFRSFFPVGPNVAWYSCKKNNQGYEDFGQPLGIYDYERYIDSLSGFANYMRIWLNRYQYLSLYGREYTQIQNGAPTVYFDNTINQKITKPHYLHFIDNAVFDPDGYVYKLLVEKRPAPSSKSNSIVIPITNHPVGTSYQLTWYNTETGLPEGSPLILQVSYFSDDQRYKAVSFRFPSTIRDLRNHSINNTFGDAVFVLVRTTS